MTTITVNDVKDFAERVERLCDFILEGLEKDGSDDVAVIQKLKKDALNLQNIQQNTSISVQGLDNYMRGIPQTV